MAYLYLGARGRIIYRRQSVEKEEGREQSDYDVLDYRAMKTFEK